VTGVALGKQALLVGGCRFHIFMSILLPACAVCSTTVHWTRCYCSQLTARMLALCTELQTAIESSVGASFFRPRCI
jgi:hypothetical protein